MKVLITGGTGFIGSALKSYFLTKGYTVHYLTKDPTKIVRKSDVKGFLWDTEKFEIDPEAFDGVDCIVNLAGKSINSKWNKRNKNKILFSRVNSSKTLFQFLEKNTHQVKHILSASAIGIYPSSFQQEFTEDETQINPKFLGQVCREWEFENNKFQKLGIQTSIIRIGMVLSKNQGALPEMAQLVCRGIGKKMGSGKQIYSWIHREDLVRMMYFILNNKIEGTFNAVSDQPVEQTKFHTLLAQRMNKKFIISRIPALVFRLMIGERSTLILDSHRVSNTKIKSAGFTFNYASLEEALEEIY